jgi:hypothetical protein
LLSVRNLLFPHLLPKSIKIKIYKTVILPVMCEMTSHLEDKHGFRVVVRRVLSGIFGSKTEEVIRGWRKVHSGEFHKMHLCQMFFG